MLLFSAPGTGVRLLVGLPLLAHVGYTALTSLPMGAIPSRPEGAKKHRRNQDLRTRVVAFLNEVRRVEEYAERAKTGQRPQSEVAADVREAGRRVMAAASEVVKAMGRVEPEQVETGRFSWTSYRADSWGRNSPSTPPAGG